MGVCCFPDSPVRTWQSCPGPGASAAGLGVEGHLRLTRCSRPLGEPWELLRGWMSTRSCPSWMRPTCPEEGRQGVGHLHTHTRPQPQQPTGSKATWLQPGSLIWAFSSQTAPTDQAQEGTFVRLEASHQQKHGGGGVRYGGVQ